MEELLASLPQKLTVLSRNQQVEGEVVAITDREIILDLGAKSEGVLQKREVKDEDLKVGSKLKAYVIQTENESGQVILSTSPQARMAKSAYRGHGINWPKFIQAQNQKTKLQGRVVEINKGGLIVEVDGTRGFLPNSQVGFELLSKAEKGLENLVGQDLTVTVLEVDENNNKLVFSQRGQVSDETLQKLKEFTANQKTKGKIVAILPFGLVVDVSGVEGLVFIADVSWEKVEDLTKLYKVGEKMEVLVTGFDKELGRLNLSLKHLTDDPFTKVAQKYQTDDVVKGEITGVGEAGVTVKLDGVEGLLPANKMEAGAKYEVGKSMSFLVDSVDMSRRKVNLAPFVTSTEGLIYK